MDIKNSLKKIFKIYYPIAILIIFAIITILFAYIRTPYWDEAHQVCIARLTPIEVIKITRVIGHPFLWYFIIKPFSSLDLYPYPLLILNWTFCLCALIVLWQKSPFNNLIKTFITFSVPFIYFFAPVARCYSFGILCLFLLCYLYPIKNKRPYLYASIIVFCANTSIMAMIGAFYIGLLFIYELYKKKNRHLKNILIIFSICSILILLQFIGVEKPYPVLRSDFLRRAAYFVILPMGTNIKSLLLHIFSSLMFYVFPIYCFIKSKKALFFITGAFLTLTLIFLIEYSGSFWHHYFYYIYFIMTFWIFYKKIYQNKFIKVLFCLILFMFCFRSAIFDTISDEFIYQSKSEKMADFILQNPEYKNAKLIVLDQWSDISPGADIFLAKTNVVLYDTHNRIRTSYDSLKNWYHLYYENVDLDRLYEYVDDNTYLLSSNNIQYESNNNEKVKKINDGYYVKTSKRTYYLKNIESRPDIKLYVYKLLNMSSYDKINL